MRSKLLALSIWLLFASPLLAQTPTATPTNWAAVAIAVTAGLAMAIASAICGLAQAKAVGAACEGMARNPGATAAIRLALFVGLAFIESLALYTLVIVFVSINKVG